MSHCYGWIHICRTMPRVRRRQQKRKRYCFLANSTVKPFSFWNAKKLKLAWRFVFSFFSFYFLCIFIMHHPVHVLCGSVVFDVLFKTFLPQAIAIKLSSFTRCVTLSQLNLMKLHITHTHLTHTHHRIVLSYSTGRTRNAWRQQQPL